MELSTCLHDAIDHVLNPQPVVSIVRLSGVIAAGGGMMRGGLNIANQAGILRAAFAPKRLAAVALVVNSPGGSPVQSALIGKRIRQHAEERKVPVIAFVEDVAASGGYWLAAAADEIIADESSIVGSIGVVSAGFGFTEAIQRLGIERRVHTQGERKRILDPFLPEKAEDVARLEALQADIHDGFKDWVRQRRQGKLTAADDVLFNGDIWTGRQAVGLGLIDSVGELRQTLRGRFGAKVRMRVVGARRPVLRRLFGTNLEAPDLMATIEERLSWGRWGL